MAPPQYVWCDPSFFRPFTHISSSFIPQKYPCLKSNWKCRKGPTIYTMPLEMMVHGGGGGEWWPSCPLFFWLNVFLLYILFAKMEVLLRLKMVPWRFVQLKSIYLMMWLAHRPTCYKKNKHLILIHDENFPPTTYSTHKKGFPNHDP